jgi:hypothetical protein
MQIAIDRSSPKTSESATRTPGARAPLPLCMQRRTTRPARPPAASTRATLEQAFGADVFAAAATGPERAVGNCATQEILGAPGGSAIQAKAAGPGVEAGSGPDRGVHPTEMPSPVSAKMEAALGADFSGVRVHPSSSSATALGALAYTQGSEIHFAPGQWAPETTRGQELLGHELWHVVQQREGRVQATAQYKGVGLNDDAGLEAEADAMGARAARATAAVPPSSAAGPAPVQRASGSQALAPVQQKRGKKGRDEEERVETEMEGNASSILRRFSSIVDRVAPSPGDTGEIEAKVKIPIDPSGAAYLGFRILAEVERRSDVVKVHFEMGLTGGAKVANLAEVGGELGFYLESQGAEAEDAMELISYGVYRRFRESVGLPREIANYGWGGSEGWRGAERWAAGVEKERLTREGTYVETGGLAIGRGEAGFSKLVKVKGEAKYSSGRRYDEKSISKYKSAGFGEETEKPERGSIEILGEDVRALKLKANVTVGPFIGDASVGLKFSKEREDDEELRYSKKHARLLSIDVSGSATGSLLVDHDIWTCIGGPIKIIASRIAAAIDRLAGEAKEKKRLRDQMQTEDVEEKFEESADAFERLSRDDALAEAIPSALLLAPGSTVDLTIMIMGTFKFTRGAKPKFELKITHGERLNVGVSAFSVKAKRGHRTLLLIYEKGTWQIE